MLEPFPARTAGSAGRWAIPWGVIGMFCLVAVGERLTSFHALDLETHVACDWKQTLEAAERIAPGCDLLCFGDSQIKLAAASRAVELASGMRVYNLALLGGQPAGSYFLLKHALARGARPQAILVAFLPRLLELGREINAQVWPDLLGPAECFDMALEARDPSFFAATMLARALPSLRLRQGIRAAVLALLGGRPASRREENLYHMRHWRVNRGAQILAEWPYHDNPRSWLDRNFKPPWKCDRVNERYVKKLLGLAASRGIRVFWLLPPHYPEVQELLDQSGCDAPYFELVRQALARDPGLVVLDARHSGYDPSVFCDNIHVNRRGTAVLSQELGTLVADLLDRPGARGRWVALPEFSARPQSVPLEDLAQSRMAMKAGPEKPGAR